MASSLTERQKYLKRLDALKNEQQTWRPHWLDLAEQIRPRRARFLSTDRNRGDKENEHIINGTPTWASRVLSSGMMAGITSPARPWFRLTTPDPELAEFGAVRNWLHVVEERLRQAFARSNVYNGLHLVYSDIGDFGTTALYIEEDPEDLLRAYVFPVGQYYLANSARGRVDTCYRELSMTVGQLVEQFGLEQCSPPVRSMYERGDIDQWMAICHAIEPNRGVQPGRSGPEGKPWRSCWFELGDGEKGELRKSGYEEFPVLAPRWSTTGEDVYGAGPGMEALGDCRALQLLEKRGAQVVDKIVSPPMRGPMSLQHQRSSLLPGDVTYVDALSAGQTFAPAYEINAAAVGVVEAKIREHEARIKTAFYADLWLLLSQTEGTMTAREVSERHEEKMLQLGPVMERLQDELLDPLIDRAFGILQRNGYLPPPPEELSGMELRVEYISIMAQAQKLLGTSSIERLAGFVGNLVAVKPDAMDKLHTDKMIDEYGSALGVKPDLVRTEEEVAEIRAQRAQAQQQQAQMEQAATAVQGAKTLSETDMQGDNALNRLLGNLGGPAAAGGMVQ